MKFRTIVADPPWRYPNEHLWDRPQSTSSAHYETLDLEQIKALPAGRFADESCALWLWTPTHHLIRGWTVEVVEAWGFRPMTTLIWCKPQIGLGHYLRNAHEPCLLGVKGSYPLKVMDQASYFTAARTGHSVKPESFYRIVERACHGPFLDLFSRNLHDQLDLMGDRPRWTVWGNEVGDPLGIGFDPDGWREMSETEAA